MTLPRPFQKWTTYKNHSGVDFPYAAGTKISASGRGVITFSGWLNSRAGNAKIIQYDGGPSVLYCHLINLNGPGHGQTLDRGELLAYVGTTGHSTGPHLHLEISGQPGFSNVWVHFSKDTALGSGGAANAPGADWIKAIQSKLNKLGARLTEDGVLGPATTAAVRDFQHAHNLSVDGVPGPQTNARLDLVIRNQRTGSNQTTRPTADIQRLVGATPDGDYGAATTAKVKDWQAAHGLTADGIWGPVSDAKGFPGGAVVAGRNATGRPTADIQRLVGATPDGDYGPATSAKVQQWQAAHGLVADGIWGPLSDARGFPG